MNPSTTYEVNVTYQDVNHDSQFNTTTNQIKTWQFTTEDAVVDITTTEPTLSAELGIPIKLGNFTALYNSGSKEDIADLVDFIYDPEVMEVNNGYVTVKKANIDHFLYLKFKYKNTSKLVGIHIWERPEPLIFMPNPFSELDTILSGTTLKNANVQVSDEDGWS